MNFTVSSKDIPKLIPKLGDKARLAIRRGAIRAAEFARARLVDASPTDMGQLRKSWVNKNPASAEALALVHNHAPHAGVIEHGARPHTVSREGVLAIYEWALRHGMASGVLVQNGDNAGLDTGAIGAAYAIANKIKTQGQKATYFVRDLMGPLTDDAGRLIAQVMAEALQKP